MIIKGKGRSNGKELGQYLSDYLVANKNERVEILEIRGGGAFKSLDRAIASWEAEAAGTRCKNALWHAQIAPAPEDKPMTREQRIEAVDILEKHLGFEGQPRAVVVHRKKDGTEHIHVAWSRIDRKTRKAKRDNFTHKKNVAAAREIEERFNMRQVESPSFEKTGTRRERREKSKKAPSYEDFQKTERSGIDPRQVQETVTSLWNSSDTGKAFRAGLESAGYILAHGDSRNYVIVDEAGDVHSLARRIKGAKAEDVKLRMRDVDPASISHVKHVQQQRRQAWQEQQIEREIADLNATGQKPSKPAAPSADIDKPIPVPMRDRFGEIIVDDKSLDPGDILKALTRQQSTFTHKNLRDEIRKRLERKEQSTDIESVAIIARQVKKHDDFLTLGNDRVRRIRYTAREIFTTELAMRDASDRMAARWNHGIGEKIRNASPTAKTLSENQREGYDHILRADGLVNVIGYPGTGKSYLLKAVNEAVIAAGFRARGTAIAGIAAEGLEKGSNIPSQTIASLLYSLDNLKPLEDRLAQQEARLDAFVARGVKGRQIHSNMQADRDRLAARLDKSKLTARDIVFVDEAGMVGSRDMKRLLEHADKAKAKVVLIGDAEQLQAIDAGGAFRALCDRHGAVKLTEIRRQEAAWAKQATKTFADGFTAEAMEAYRSRGHIRDFASRDQARTRLIEDWTASRAANPNEKHIIFGFLRADVGSLNEQARAIYRAEGRLGIDETIKTATGRKEFARGDRFYFLETNRDMKVKNGTVGTVEKIERQNLTDYHRMTIKLDDGRTVQFNTADYTKFDLGYASTVHKSQGVTAGRAHVLASEHMNRHAALVSMSRHVKQVDMYYGLDEFRDYKDLERVLSRDARKDTTLDYIARAEKLGLLDVFIKKVQKVATVLTVAEKRERAAERLAAALRLTKNPRTRQDRLAEREAKEAARKLRDILGKRPDRKRGIGLSL